MTNDSTSHSDDVKTIADLVKDAKVGLLTTMTADGHLVSRPLAMQQIEFDGDLWFFSQDPSPKIDDIGGNPEVNVAFESGKGWVSIAGTATVSHDDAKIDELWNSMASAWFPEGREDPSVSLIKVTAHTAEFWANFDPKVVQLFKLAKAAVSGGQPDLGENKTVEL
jgi:general stress protein 26